jgi:hypothetical protein
MGLGCQVSFDALSLGFEGRILLSLLGSNAYRNRPPYDKCDWWILMMVDLPARASATK